MTAALPAAHPPAAHPPAADVQGFHDPRDIPIQDVGVRGVRVPVQVAGRDGRRHHSVARLDMFVSLEGHKKGAHMSRFMELAGGGVEIGPDGARPLAEAMLGRLEAKAGRVELHLPVFLSRPAPVTGAAALLDCDLRLWSRVSDRGAECGLAVVVPVTSLCPCSKAISRHGAHSQRSHVTVEIEGRDGLPPFEDMVELVEAQASCAIFPLLKRADEKFVTERAYENPKFVEDMVRDVAAALEADPRIGAFAVSCENFESIHTHSAFARIERRGDVSKFIHPPPPPG